MFRCPGPKPRQEPPWLLRRPVSGGPPMRPRPCHHAPMFNVHLIPGSKLAPPKFKSCIRETETSSTSSRHFPLFPGQIYRVQGSGLCVVGFGGWGLG